MLLLLRKMINFNVCKTYSTQKFCVGDKVQIIKRIVANDLETFSQLSGDVNPIHLGERGIVHGAYLNSLVSGVIGTKLPGEGTLVVTQNLRFPNKCYVGDSVIIEVQLTSIRKLLQIVYKCECNGKIVMEGDAKLMVHKSF